MVLALTGNHALVEPIATQSNCIKHRSVKTAMQEGIAGNCMLLQQLRIVWAGTIAYVELIDQILSPAWRVLRCMATALQVKLAFNMLLYIFLYSAQLYDNYFFLKQLEMSVHLASTVRQGLLILRDVLLVATKTSKARHHVKPALLVTIVPAIRLPLRALFVLPVVIAH